MSRLFFVFAFIVQREPVVSLTATIHHGESAMNNLLTRRQRDTINAACFKGCDINFKIFYMKRRRMFVAYVDNQELCRTQTQEKMHEKMRAALVVAARHTLSAIHTPNITWSTANQRAFDQWTADAGDVCYVPQGIHQASPRGWQSVEA